MLQKADAISWLQEGTGSLLPPGTEKGDLSFWFIGGCSLKHTTGLSRPQTEKSTSSVEGPISQNQGFHNTLSSLGFYFIKHFLQDPKLSPKRQQKRVHKCNLWSLGQLLLLVTITVVTIMGGGVDGTDWGQDSGGPGGNDKNQVNLQGLREVWRPSVLDLESWGLTRGISSHAGDRGRGRGARSTAPSCCEAGQCTQAGGPAPPTALLGSEVRAGKPAGRAV